MRSGVFVLILTLGLTHFTGCAQKKQIVIDPTGVDMGQYQKDQQECEYLATQISKGESAAKGAVGGAVVGGLLGAAVGDSRDAQRMAGAGAVLGAAGSANEAQMEQNQIVKNCLINRGYKVLN